MPVFPTFHAFSASDNGNLASFPEPIVMIHELSCIEPMALFIV